MAGNEFKRWLASAGKGALQGAVAAFILWNVVNRLHTVNGVGWLERQGLPWSNIYLMVFVGALVGTAIGLVRQTFLAAQSHGVEEAARRLRFAFEPDVTREDLAEAGKLRFFDKWRSGSNRLTGQVDGLHVEMLDYAFVEKVNKQDTEFTQTVAILPAVEGLPVFELRPRHVMQRLLGLIGMEGVTFDPEQAPPEDARAVQDFGRGYFLSRGGDEEIVEKVEELEDGEVPRETERQQPVRRLFTTELLRYFAANLGWSVDSNGKHLALWRAGTLVPDADRDAFLEKILQMRQSIVRAAEGSAGTIVPASPGTREIAATQGRLLGAILGLFTGIVLAVVVSPWVYPVLRMFAAVFFFGIIALGPVVGWFVGGLVLVPGLAFLNRRQQTRRSAALAESPWRQPDGSTAVVNEDAEGLTIRFPAGGLVRGGGGVLLVGCVLVNLFLIGFSAIWVPLALRGEVAWIENDKAPQPGQAPVMLAPWKALLFMVPFWLAGLTTIVALVYRARRRALLKVGADGLRIEEVTLFGTRQQAWPREELADVKVMADETAKVPRKLHLAVVTFEGSEFYWLRWRSRTEVKWATDLVRQRLGMAGE